uniref:SMODS and SLOG-associating 2TM effector domain-containing protein n=1 Tax=viral metagenome TaxID=1070528 RepID=A0A6C0BA75_9ZZZZ
MELPSEDENHALEQLTTIIDGSTDWSQEHEKILIEWADKAMCYRWLHSRANSLYSNLNAWYTIPVIVISTLTGTANFALTRVPLEYQNYFAMGVGAFNILGGIVTTIQQFLKITQLNESHRVSSIAWDKFYRNVKIELAKHPSERMQSIQMLKMCKEEFDRLMETSPVIPDKIISSFKSSFKNSDAFEKIVKPEICDVLVSTEFSRNQWFNDENREKRMSEAAKVQLTKENQQKHTKEMNLLTLRDFKRTFFNLNNREAMEEEIIDNLKDKIEEELLKKLIEEFKSEEIV